MNKEHLKVPQWIPGPPGTGKTSEWLFNKYVEMFKKRNTLGQDCCISLTQMLQHLQ